MTRIRPSLRLLCFTLAALTCVGTLGAQPTLKPEVEKELGLATYDLQDLLLPAGDPAEFLVFLTLGSDDYTLELKRHSMRGDGFQVLAQEESGELIRTEVPAPKTYRGTIRGPQSGGVAATLVDGQLHAAIIFDDQEQWWVQPVVEGAGEQSGLHAVYQPSGVELDELARCGTDELPQADLDHSHDDNSTLVTGNKVCEVSFDADFEFYNKNGSSVSNTLVDIERVMNTVEFVYERDTSITYELTTLVVRTAEPDPYTSTNPSTLLNQFRNHWNSNFTWVQRDIAHFMTGKNIDGGVIGIAWVGVICNKSSGYGLSESRFTGSFTSRVALTAHELGHNWNAGHCDGNGDCHIMCSGLGGCNGLGGPRFGNPSINTIVGYKNSRGCLFNEPDPQTIPFGDGFPSTVIDTNKWTWNQGALINTAGVSEPTAPNSLNLDAANSNDYRDDEIRTGFFDLLGKNNLLVSYYTEHRGVANGNDLVVEYWTGALFRWDEVNRVTSDGSNQSSYQFHEQTLPFLASHGEFRLRFRTEVDGTSEDWYIDNVFIRQIPALVEITPPSPGQVATAEVRNLEPGESASLLFNFVGQGVPTCLFGGTLCVDLGSPFFALPFSVNADANGTATFNVNVPASAPIGLNLWFQGVVLRNPNKLSDSSNVIQTAIQ